VSTVKYLVWNDDGQVRVSRRDGRLDKHTGQASSFVDAVKKLGESLCPDDIGVILPGSCNGAIDANQFWQQR
jgi:hypothetical protein